MYSFSVYILSVMLINVILCFSGGIVILKLLLRRLKYSWKLQYPKCRFSVAFFHPYCNAGGGGERVLWAAVRFLLLRYDDIHCVVYTGDTGVTSEDILRKVKTQFAIDLPRPVEFVFLRSRKWVEAEKYPYFTLLLQSLGSIVLGVEALFKFVPDIYIDSMGYAFTYPVFKYLGSCKVGCYVHYPVISTDMLDRVSSQRESHNNRRFISNSAFFTNMKVLYYRVFAFLYRLVGSVADTVMVNSSWTKRHICTLWKNPSSTFLVFPPCDVSEFKTIPLDIVNTSKTPWRILSVAQFRPEKDHALQIRAFHELLNRLDDEEKRQTTLVLAGSCRNADDQDRVTKLEKLCSDLGVSDNVEFKLNLSFKELKEEMQKAQISLHTMWNEHFGIGIVEGMAAGLITVAHDSGGPKLDIVVEFNNQKTGFLANDIDSYADTIERILRMPAEEILAIQKNARLSVARFSIKKFEHSFFNATEMLF